MPQDYKTSINNLIVVWQGSSWSVIAPDGTVLYRSIIKTVACDFAENYIDYAGSEYAPFDGYNDWSPAKPKRGQYQIVLNGLPAPIIGRQDMIAHLGKRASYAFAFLVWKLIKTVALGLFQAFIWVVDAFITILVVCGVYCGGLITLFALPVMLISGFCRLVTRGWPFEPQVFPNSLIIAFLAFAICVICSQIAQRKGIDL